MLSFLEKVKFFKNILDINKKYNLNTVLLQANINQELLIKTLNM